MRLFSLLPFLFVILTSCSDTKVDLIVRNAVIYTVDDAFSTAQAMAIDDGKILAVGTNQEIMKAYDAEQTLDAEGQPVYPGFIDAHAHFLAYGRSLFSVDLSGAASWDEVVSRVKKFADEHPNELWITGRGWDQNLWTAKTFPDNNDLNTLFPNRPVLLTRIDGHAAIANQKALDTAGLAAGATIAGGTIETKNGKLTGLLIDNAVDLVSAKIPAAGIDEYVKWLGEAEKRCFGVGLTTVADCGLMYNDVQIIDGLQKEGTISMRLYVMLSDDTANYSRYLHKEPYKTDRMYVKGIKVYADGALGSRGACLLQPYSDRADWNGFLLKDPRYFDSLASQLVNTDYQMCTHAIGDSANRVVLTIYNKVLKGSNDKRWRIEHAQVVNSNDLGLFGKTSVIPSVQPTHATSDMHWAGERLGNERIKGGYAYRQLLMQNGWLPLGTDFPVEDINPLNTFYAAVVRKDSKGAPANGFQKENALTREQALRGMTIWAARACFMEEEVGSLEAGKKADFIIMNDDLMKMDEKQILSGKVVATYLGGKKVW